MLKRMLRSVLAPATALVLAACGGGSGSSVPATSYTIGGTLSGLNSGQSITLIDNGADALALSGNGPFQFSVPVGRQGSYRVILENQPAGQTCSVLNGTGSGVVANVTNVSIQCADTYQVGGTLSGLATNGYVNLLDNDSAPLQLKADGAFSFPVAAGASYAVTIESQSLGQACTLTNGTGTNVQAAIDNMSIICTPDTPTEDVLHGFAAGSDGASPQAGVVADATGALYGTTHAGGSHGEGTVYKLTPNGAGGYAESILYSFTGGADGSHPDATLLLDANGNLYGEAGPGNTSGGSVFMLSPASNGTYMFYTLSTFSGAAGGDLPTGGLVQDDSGDLYGTAMSSAEAGGHGSVFELTPSSPGVFAIDVLYAFAGGADGANPESGVAFDATGNLYGTTPSGGPSDLGTVFELATNAVGGYAKSTLHAFGGVDGSQPTGSLVFDFSGNLYGTTRLGGTNGDGTVFEIAQGNGGAVETVLHSFTGGADGANPEAGLLIDGDGNLYGEAFGGGSGDGAIFKIAPAGAGAFAFATLYAFAATPDGSGPIGGLAFDAAGNLYGATQSGGTAGAGTVFRVKL